MKKNICIGVLIAIVVALALYIGLGSKKVSAPVPTEQSSQQAVSVAPTDTTETVTADADKESTTIPSPADSNVITYTSYKLGIQFSYLNNGGPAESGWGSGVVTPVESGNKILLTYVQGGKTDADTFNYVEVFQKTPSESADQALRTAMPQEFTNSNCVVLQGATSNQYFIWDKRAPLGQRGADSTDFVLPDGTWATNTCGHDMPLTFFTDSGFPDKMYYVSYDTQAPTFAADSTLTKSWTQTVHLIN